MAKINHLSYLFQIFLLLTVLLLPIQLTDGTPVTIPTASITVDGNSDDWKGITPIMTDPEGDGTNVQGSDLKTLYALKDSSFLYLMLEVYNNPNGAPERVDYLFDIANNINSLFLKWDYQPGGDAQGGTWLWNLTEYDTRVNYKNPNPYGLTIPIPGAVAMGRTVFEMKVPLVLIGNPENMIIRARTVVGQDKSADDMPSAKFITNPSLLKKTAETKISTPLSTPFVIINKPKDRDTVPWRYMVEGSSSAIQNSGLIANVLIWNIESGGPWWTQPTTTFPDGNWQSNAYIGRDPKIYPEDIGSTFKVVSIITNKKLSGTFSELPEYTVKSEEIIVTRGDDNALTYASTPPAAPKEIISRADDNINKGFESNENRSRFSEGLKYFSIIGLISLVLLGIVLFFEKREKISIYLGKILK